MHLMSSGLRLFIVAFGLLALAACSDPEAGTDTGETGTSVPETTQPDPTTGPGAIDRGQVETTPVDPGLARFGPKTKAGLEGFAKADRVFFEFDKSDITASSRGTLDLMAQWLNHYSDVRFTVEGHADIRGTREYNLALGERRANAVKNYLTARGVSARRMEVISFGKERPVVPGTSERAHAQNRRSVIDF